jgi:cell division ATPase FtsA
MNGVTRRGWMKVVAGLVAGLWARIRGKAAIPRGGHSRIVVEAPAQERGSIITVERDGVTAITRIPIGDYHFSNDVSICLHLPPQHAREVTETYGILPEASRHGSIYLVTEIGRNATSRRNGGFFVPRKLFAEVLEARAEEFALFVRKGLQESGVGEESAPVFVAGARFSGLAEVMERVLQRPVSTNLPMELLGAG